MGLMPVTKRPSNLLTKEQKEKIVELYGTKLYSTTKVTEETGIRTALIQRYLLEIGLYRHRNAPIEYFPEPKGRMWSKHEQHYGRNGANNKYIFEELSETEQSIIDQENHDELKQF